MKFAQFFLKPKWQHKNPTVRRHAVSNEASTQLIGQLAEIARSDSDSTVRLAALQRLNDFELNRERSTADQDATIRKFARARYLEQFATAAEPIDSRVRQLVALEANEIEQIAQRATIPKLRLAALERVQRQSVLIDRAVNDPESIVRQAALERINDPAALSRVIEKTRKTDKRLNRIARERLQSLKLLLAIWRRLPNERVNYVIG